MEITIIIPCHNIENYIGRCLQSIIKQSYDKSRYEIIIIFDSCTDRTEIVAKNKLENSGIIYRCFNVDLKNAGLARNVGLENASGKYVWFIDGDDYLLDDNAFSKQVYAMEKSKCNATYQKKFQSDEPVTDDDAIWRFFFKREFLIGEKFPNVEINEDWIFVKSLKKKDTYSEIFIDDLLYHYTFPRDGSLTHEHGKHKPTHFVLNKKQYTSGMKMNYICAIVKDEHRYIREWALYHRGIGFDRIIIYDNNSHKPYDSELGDLIDDGFIEIRNWSDTSPSRQLNAYNDFVHSSEWLPGEWCAFIDVDEFICFDNVQTISEFVRLYNSYAGVGLSWKTYNANGHIQAPEGVSTFEAYTTTFDYPEPRIKFIARLADIEDIYSAHAFIPKRGLFVTTGGTPIFEQDPEYQDYKNGHIKHYLTKSWEDWVIRLKRGNITKGLRTVDTFFTYNPDMADLKEELTKGLDYNDFPTIRNKGD